MKLLQPKQPTDKTDNAKTILIYGETQTGKTSLIGAIAREHYLRTGKITRLILCDEGGPSAIQPEIDEGIIQVADMAGDLLPQSNLMWLARGHWIGEDGKIDQRKQNLEGVGIIALDSLSAAAALVMSYFIQNNVKISQEIVALREEQNLKFGQAAQSHYGAVHGLILQLTTTMGSLPVDRVIYTALESKAEDNIDKSIILGPMIIGKALTGVIPSRMNRILHLEIVPSVDNKTRSYRIYFMPHNDRTLGKVWPANMRLPPRVLGQLKDHPKYSKGYIDFETGDELVVLLDYCAELVRPKVVENLPAAAAVVAGEPAKPVAPANAVNKIQSLTNKNIFPQSTTSTTTTKK